MNQIHQMKTLQCYIMGLRSHTSNSRQINYALGVDSTIGYQLIVWLLDIYIYIVDYIGLQVLHILSLTYGVAVLGIRFGHDELLDFGSYVTGMEY